MPTDLKNSTNWASIWTRTWETTSACTSSHTSTRAWATSTFTSCCSSGVKMFIFSSCEQSNCKDKPLQLLLCSWVRPNPYVRSLRALFLSCSPLTLDKVSSQTLGSMSILSYYDSDMSEMYCNYKSMQYISDNIINVYLVETILVKTIIQTQKYLPP